MRAATSALVNYINVLRDGPEMISKMSDTTFAIFGSMQVGQVFVANNMHAAAALNGTLVISYASMKA